MEFKSIKPMVSEAIYDIDGLPEGDYLYQEKITGMRGNYNPVAGHFYTINGNLIPGTQHLEKELKGATIPFDGEFFLSSLTDAQISGQARKKKPEYQLEFHVFDIADKCLIDEERQKTLDKMEESQYIKRVKTFRGDKAAVFAYLKEVLNRGGEGVIVRDPTKTYKYGESGTIKLKEFDIPDDFNRWDK